MSANVVETVARKIIPETLWIHYSACRVLNVTIVDNYPKFTGESTSELLKHHKRLKNATSALPTVYIFPPPTRPPLDAPRHTLSMTQSWKILAIRLMRFTRVGEGDGGIGGAKPFSQSVFQNLIASSRFLTFPNTLSGCTSYKFQNNNNNKDSRSIRARFMTVNICIYILFYHYDVKKGTCKRNRVGEYLLN